MLPPLPMPERHGLILLRLVEMTGGLTERAYKRATQAETPEEMDHAALVFDRLARGLRLTLALEARMARDQRRDQIEIDRTEAAPPAAETARPPRTDRRPSGPCEADHEGESDHQSPDLSLNARFKDIASLLDEQADLLDPDGRHRAALAEVTDWWALAETGPDLAREPGSPPETEPQRRRRLQRLRRRADDPPGPITGPDPPRRRSG